MPHAAVVPFRLRSRSDDLRCDVLRTPGYVARCGCGWRGKVRGGYDEARQDAREHTEHLSSTSTPSTPAA